MTSEEQMELTLKNLQKVYDELPKLAEKIPSIKEDFDMDIFGVYYEKDKEQVLNSVCQTQGCLLGNAARLFDLNKNEYYDRFGFEYMQFCVINFPALFEELTPIDSPMLGDFTKESWNFLFSDTWAQYQPTFEEAMNRIKYFLDQKGDIGSEDYDWFYNENFLEYEGSQQHENNED